MSNIPTAHNVRDKCTSYTIPSAFSYDIYVNHPNNGDLAGFSEEGAWNHYVAYGREEGRVCSSITSRQSFLDVIPVSRAILEIGPFFTPSFDKMLHDVHFMDILSTSDLRKKALDVPGADPSHVPEIDYVWEGQSYSSIVNRKFDCVFSSHCIEHQPCLIGHINEVASVLNDGGRYFIVMPDKRYCFDRFIPESNIADVMEAYITSSKRPSLRAVMRGWLLSTHNDPVSHWASDNSDDPTRHFVTREHGLRLQQVVSHWKAISGQYPDAHVWQFTPDNFSHLMQLACAAGFLDMEVEEVYPTLKNTLEFFAVLRKSPKK
jgi:SAM-dependent methyltransferase